MSNDLRQIPAWVDLEEHAKESPERHIRDLFSVSPQRFDIFHLEHNGILFDYSRQNVTEQTLSLLMDLARQRGLEDWRDQMFSGEKINTTENRAVLHTALRCPATDHIEVDGENVMPFVEQIRQHMKAFSNDIHSGKTTGSTGKKIKHIVNIGIGGSDLGPYMACEALKPWQKNDIESYFVSNVDGTHISEVLKVVDPETTLFLVASKTFTTQETMTNAMTAKKWLVNALGKEEAVAYHFAAMSTNTQAVQDFGIDENRMFPFESWVGGRFSLWSAIGLSIALSVGYDHFESLLEGAHAMDIHFQTAPLEENIPVLLGLLGIWNRNFLGYNALAILPYDQYLHRFPAFLQQLDMESNGKYLTRDGKPVNYDTGPVIFGEPGTNGQHAFFQLLHQGANIIPCDFIAPKVTQNPTGDHHKLLLANMVAQAEAMMTGRTLEEAQGDQQRVFEGNRPSNILLFDEISPYHLGQLTALYEHKVFVQGIIWGINSFDQFGVELGKEMANRILSEEKQDVNRIGILEFL